MHYHHDISSVEKDNQVLKVVFFAQLLFLIVEAGFGFYLNSLALLSDAWHMVGDNIAILLALAASSIAKIPPTLNKSYGYSAIQKVAAEINSVALMGISLYILYESWHRINNPLVIKDYYHILWIGVVGFIVNIFSFFYLHRASSGSLNIKGALAHMFSDALGSLGAVTAGVLLYSGHYWADPLVGAITGCIVFYSGLQIYKKCFKVTMGFAPDSMDPESVKLSLHLIKGVDKVEDLHLWTLDGSKIILSVQLFTSDDEREVLNHAVYCLKHMYSIDHSTVQVNYKVKT